MKIVLQRVQHAQVVVDEKIVGAIQHGLLVLLGISPTDTTKDIEYLCKKITQLRIFNDDNGVMNLSVQDVNGSILVISQFTLYANTSKGNRPSYIEAARPEIAEPIYEEFKKHLSTLMNQPIACGIFGADMKVSLLNDGPVTIVLESQIV